MLNSISFTKQTHEKCLDKIIRTTAIWYHKHKLIVNSMAIRLDEVHKLFLIVFIKCAGASGIIFILFFFINQLIWSTLLDFYLQILP